VKKILIICPYPAGLAPSQRFRFEQYLEQLYQAGFHTDVRPFFSHKNYRAFYQSRNLLSKIHAIIQSYWRRLALLFQARSADFVFIHREATPLGPPLIEWWIARILGRKIIYDFDDAIWLTDNTHESRLERMLRWRSKVGSICRWSFRVSSGNEYLASYARAFNSSVIVNPTTVTSDYLHSSTHSVRDNADKIVIGWTGSRSTLKYLDNLVPMLKMIEERYPSVEFLVVADQNPSLPLKSFRYIPWAAETEIASLMNMDIGLMPIPDDEWAKGKCGLKALQYMAIGIPALVSPVGVNRDIINHGKEGYWCSSPDEWYTYIVKLILNPQLRQEMGQLGREKIAVRYSVEANTPTFLSLFT
jgi:glycosyltransferase involved in cell wall biosynthesis